jgi:murein L,D-transpeptidase YafK
MRAALIFILLFLMISPLSLAQEGVDGESRPDIEEPVLEEEPPVVAPESDNLSGGENGGNMSGHYPDIPPAAFEPPAGALIANVFSSDSVKHTVVLVTKQAKKLFLLNVEGDKQERIAGVDVISGRFAGAKRVEGDKRTPDGIYYTTSFLSADRLHDLYGDYADIYGFGAFPTNYPNPSDKALGYTGYGIWLHGLNPHGHKDTTEGCVAMENTDYEKVKEHLSVGQTVIFADHLLWEDEDSYAEKREAEFEKLNAFFNSWRNGEYDTYKNFIHPKYKSYVAANAAKYLAGKKELMRHYPNKMIELNNIKIYRVDDNSTVYDLEQFYCAENTLSFAEKKYYFTKDADTQRLISEEIKVKDVRLYLDKPIRDFVEGWAAAWEAMDIEKYSSFYSKAVHTGKWRKYKEAVFSSTERIDVEISGLAWRMVGKNRYRINFMQEYQADTLSDKGNKTLEIKGCPGGFMIESESWERSK